MKKIPGYLFMVLIIAMWVSMAFVSWYILGDVIFGLFMQATSLAFPVNAYMFIGLIVSIWILFGFAKEPAIDAIREREFINITIGSAMFLSMSLLFIPLITISYPAILYYYFDSKKQKA
ncbi:MAG: hypothetical protein C0602_00300 [Denitrovibrio sp.]|nr:MAG: hypothetical protein C0602_00300 [Denitrovibrio sp.]